MYLPVLQNPLSFSDDDDVDYDDDDSDDEDDNTADLSLANPFGEPVVVDVSSSQVIPVFHLTDQWVESIVASVEQKGVSHKFDIKPLQEACKVAATPNDCRRYDKR